MAQVVRKHAQRLPDAGAEAVRLGQHGGEGAYFFHAGAQRQVAQRLLARAAGAHFQVGPVQLLRERLALDLDFLGDLGQPGVQPEPRLHAHQHEVGGVGKVLEDLAAPRADAKVQQRVGQVTAGQRRQREPQQHRHATRRTRRAQHEERDGREAQRQQRLQAEVDEVRIRVSDAGVQKAHAQRRQVGIAGRGRQLRERADELDGRLGPGRLA
ncbi:hypothetical protein D3C71_1457730 [compost metagenome]